MVHAEEIDQIASNMPYTRKKFMRLQLTCQAKRAATFCSCNTSTILYNLPHFELSHTNKLISKDRRRVRVRVQMPGLTIGDTVPNIEAETTHGNIKLHDYIGDGWAIIFSHPGDFTPVCTTELGKMAAYAEEFSKRGVKLVGLSCDDVHTHNEWIKDIEAYTPGCKVSYPIIADSNREIMKQLNMVDPDEKDSSGNNLPSRALHIVGPDKKVKLSFLYPSATGRNMDEVVRVLDSLQKTSKNKVATPANWRPGEAVVISPNVSNEEAKQMFPDGYKTVDLPSNKDYLRFTNIV